MFKGRRLQTTISILMTLATALIGISAHGWGQNFKPVYSKKGMVVGPERRAVEAGVNILNQGGNAFDAAVAVGFALAVTYPQAGNLGGGGFMVGNTAEGQALFLDFREEAPGQAGEAMFLDDEGHMIDGLSTETLLASGVPGTVHGLHHIWQKHGTLSWKSLLQAAVRLAEQGYPVRYSQAQLLKQKQAYLTRFDSTAEIFYPQGRPLEFGELFIQEDLAHTLKQIRDHGPQGFYEGETADKLVAYMRVHEGIITHEDLKNYRSKFRKPIVFDYNGHTFIAPNLPSSGGITLAQIFHFLEPLDLPAMGHNSAAYANALVEAERLAFADRNHFLADSDHVEVPVHPLLSEAYLEKRRRLMPLGRAGDSQKVSHGEIAGWKPESPQTTHFCVVDEERNVAAITTTLNSAFGMGGVVKGAGFLLNNEMDDFSAKPGAPNLYGLVEGEANAVAPGKRPLSSMTPMIVLKNGQIRFTSGTPGGPTIITTNLQIALNIIEFGMNIRQAIDRPRFHHQWLPDHIQHETYTFSADTQQKLNAMGYTFNNRGSIGKAVGIQLLESGVLAGHADARMEGAALGQ